LISDPIRSADLRLLVMIDRSETIAFLNNIKINTIAAILISIVSIVFFFFFVSRKLANPYKRALQLNMELEEKIAERTRELALRNEEMMDSIGYAKRIQESLLPNPESLDKLFREHFVIWTPKDQVGGDFFWVKRSSDGGMWAAVGDCTGHGVPGAFMTMLSVSMLDRILEQYPDATPAFVLERLNRMIKSTLHQEDADGLSDDGLDLGILFVQQEQMRFAGAKSHLFVRSADETHVYTGDRKSIGYRRTPSDYRFTESVIPRSEGDVFYMASDGFFDQSGGEKGFSFGKRRFLELLDRIGGLPLREQRDAVVSETKAYRGKESIRDDVTLLAFRC
jgi:serine phosphatase RsbU (regulator of sigma subunit)